MKEKAVDRCWSCGGNMVEREAPTIIVVACDRKCGAMYTKKKKLKTACFPS